MIREITMRIVDPDTTHEEFLEESRSAGIEEGSTYNPSKINISSTFRHIISSIVRQAKTTQQTVDKLHQMINDISDFIYTEIWTEEGYIKDPEEVKHNSKERKEINRINANYRWIIDEKWKKKDIESLMIELMDKEQNMAYKVLTDRLDMVEKKISDESDIKEKQRLIDRYESILKDEIRKATKKFKPELQKRLDRLEE